MAVSPIMPFTSTSRGPRHRRDQAVDALGGLEQDRSAAGARLFLLELFREVWRKLDVIVAANLEGKTENAFDGVMLGAAWRVHEKLSIGGGYVIRVGQELSPGFRAVSTSCSMTRRMRPITSDSAAWLRVAASGTRRRPTTAFPCSIRSLRRTGYFSGIPSFRALTRVCSSACSSQ